MSAAALTGLRVVTFEARRSAELERMLARHDATVICAPALREERLDETPAALAFAERLGRGEIGLVILLTGVGTRALAAAVTPVHADFLAWLAKTPIVARGPKPQAALRELNVAGALPVASPFTWRQVLDAVDALALPRGTRVAIQEYGAPNPSLAAALAERGFEILSVPVYRWRLPEDVAPLRDAAGRLARGDADVAVFTSAVQAHHLLRIAADADALRAGLRRVVVASIGPTCSEALVEHGIAVDLEADPPKLGPLVATIASQAWECLGRKRA